MNRYEEAVIEQKKDDLISLLREGIVDVVFTKYDGTTRKMKATLQPEYYKDYFKYPIDQAKVYVEEETNYSDVRLHVWDVEENFWRCFRFDRIQTVNGKVWGSD